MTAPVSIHPVTIIDMMMMKKINTFEKKKHRSYIFFSCTSLHMFIPVLRTSSANGNKEEREEGKKKKRRVKKKGKTFS